MSEKLREALQVLVDAIDRGVLTYSLREAEKVAADKSILGEARVALASSNEGWQPIETATAHGAHWLGDAPGGDVTGVLLFFNTEEAAKEFLEAYSALPPPPSTERKT